MILNFPLVFLFQYSRNKMTLLLHFLLQSREFSDTGLTDTKKAKTVPLRLKREKDDEEFALIC